MEDNYQIGNVLSIEGNKVHIIMKENNSMFVYFFNGKKYNGVINNGYIGIIRGPYKIVGRVEKESLEDIQKDDKDRTYSLDRFRRIVEVKIIGYLNEGRFVSGLSYLPLICNEAVLLSEDEIESIYIQSIKFRKNDNNSSCSLVIGTSLQEGIPIPLDVFNLFNTHLGIFGNTGSGKSNTLTYLYTMLFENKKLDVTKNSKFLILDFNGEYTGDDVFNNDKEIIKLSTRNDRVGNKIKISKNTFWDSEFLSVLFSATDKTQKPFIKKLLKYKNKLNVEKLDNRIKSIVKTCFRHLVDGNKFEILTLLKGMFSIYFVDVENETILSNISWIGKTCKNISDGQKIVD